MAKKINFDLCKEAVSTLANVGSSAETIVTEAKNSCKGPGPVFGPDWTTVPNDKKIMWEPVAEDNGWRIEQNKFTKHVRLLDPMRKCKATIWLEDKLVDFLSHINRIGGEEIKINDCFSNMALDKDGEFIVLVGRMGARHTYSVSIDNKSTGFGFNGAGKGSFTVGVNTNFKSELKKRVEYDVYYEDNMANFSDDLLINSRWFKNDKDMNVLFTSRKERKLTSFNYNYESSLSNSSNIDFSVEARNIGVDEARLKGAFEKRNGVYRKFTVEF